MRRDRARVTVVIPTCNRPDLLRDAVACVVDQSEAPDEIIIVNNGTGPIELELPDNGRVVDIMPFAGASQARNFGVLLAHGDFIAFLDDDDIWEAEYIQKVRDLIDQAEPDLLITRLDRMVDGAIRPYRDVSRVPNLEIEVLTSNPGVGGPNTIVRRAAFLQVGGYDPELITSEDRSLYLEFVRHGYKIVTNGDIQAIARDPGGERLTNPERMAEGKRRFLRKYLRTMPRRVARRNLAIIHYQRFRATHYPWHLAITAWYLGLSWLTPGKRGPR